MYTIFKEYGYTPNCVRKYMGFIHLSNSSYWFTTCPSDCLYHGKPKWNYPHYDLEGMNSRIFSGRTNTFMLSCPMCITAIGMVLWVYRSASQWIRKPIFEVYSNNFKLFSLCNQRYNYKAHFQINQHWMPICQVR